MAHEAGAVNGTWCFQPRVVLAVVFSLPVSSVGHQSPLPNPSCWCGGEGPDQPRTPCTSFVLEMGSDGNALAAPWALLLEMMSPLVSSAWGVLVSPWHPCVVSFGTVCQCSHGFYWPTGSHSSVAVLGGRCLSQQLLVELFQTLLATEDVLPFLFHRETTHSWKTPADG